MAIDCWRIAALPDDTLRNLSRWNQGVLYREILTDVCGKLSVKFSKKAETIALEEALSKKVLEDSLEKMSEEELRDLAKEVGLPVAGLGRAAILPALHIAINAGGFADHQIAVIVANSVAKMMLGHGLALAGKAALGRGIAVFAGPVGLIVGGLLAVPLISGPAYRVTVPACLHVAYMRQKNLNCDYFK